LLFNFHLFFIPARAPPVFRLAFRWDELGQEIMKIAVPGALALMADPVASLVDTAFIGHSASASGLKSDPNHTNPYQHSLKNKSTLALNMVWLQPGFTREPAQSKPYC
jgi:hypothetical protein